MRYVFIHFILNSLQNIEPKGTTKTSYLNLGGFSVIIGKFCQANVDY